MDESNILEKAYKILFPYSKVHKEFLVEYSGRVKDYGGNLSMRGNSYTLKISKKFLGVDEDIQMGMAQELLCKITKRRTKTLQIDLYNNFVKNLHLAIEKNKIDPILEESFDRVNDKYFLGLVEKPNLVWGRKAIRTFGSYDFKNDTITVSRIFQDNPDVRYVDYIMFHEMLHKQRKFKNTGSKTIYHDSVFKKAEKIFKDADKLEKGLSLIATKARAKAFFKWN